MTQSISSSDLALLVFTDDLTGLWNRRFLEVYLQQRIDWDRPEDPVAMVLIDVDHFKEINDKYGHLEGDRVLRALGQALRKEAPEPAAACRYAGDEFCVFLPGLSKEQGAERAMRMLGVLAEATEGMPVTVSAGVAAFPEDAASAAELLNKADAALYGAKHAGRAQVVSAGREEGPLRPHLPCPQWIRTPEEEQAVDGMLDLAGGGTPQWLLLEGEVGSGKSRMLREVADRAQSRGMLYLLTRCQEYHPRVPYRMLVFLLRRVIQAEPELARAILKHLEPAHVAALADVFPPVRSLMTLEAEPPPDLRQRRRALFEAVARFLVELSTRRGLVLLFDNAQHLDPGTIKMLRWLSGSGKRPFLVGLALRSELLNSEDLTRSSLGAWLGSQDLGAPWRRMQLTPWEEPQVKAFLAGVLPNFKPPPRFMARLAEQARGNPLYLEAAVLAFLERGLLQTSANGWVADPAAPEVLPESLNELLGWAMERAEPEERELLTNAAVLGEEFDLRLLHKVLGVDEGRAQDVLDRFEQRGVILRPPGEEHHHFGSRKAQEAVYSSIPEPQREQMHRRIGEKAEELSRSDSSIDPGFLSHHFKKGGEPAKEERYRKLVEQAALAVFDDAETEELVLQAGARGRVFTQDPGEQGTEATMRFLRALQMGLKTRTMYPEGSARITQAVEEAKQAWRSAVESAGGLTLVVERDGLKLNGRSLDGTRDFVPLFRVRRIRAVSFGPNADPGEGERFLDAIMAPQERGEKRRQSWEAFSSDGGQVWVVEERYRGGDETATRTRAGAPAVETPVPAEAEPLVLDLLRGLRAGVQAARMYPPESRIVRDAVDVLQEAREGVLRHVPALTLAAVDETLLVNGCRAEEERFGTGTDDVAQLIASRASGSLTWLPGGSREETAALVEILSQEAPDWNAFFADHPEARIQAGGFSYSVEDPGRSASQAEETVTVKMTQADILRALLANSDEEFVKHFDGPAPLQTIKQEWKSGDRSLVESVLKRLVDLRCEGPLRGLAAADDSIAQAVEQGALAQGILAGVFLPRSIQAESWEAAEAWLKVADDKEVQACVKWLTERVDRSTGDSKEAAQVLDQLAARGGEDQIPAWIERWVREDDRVRRSVWARWVFCAGGGQAVADRLGPTADAAVLEQIISVLGNTSPPEVLQAAQALVAHPDRSIRDHTIELAARIAPRFATSILRAAMASPWPDLWKPGLEALARRGLEGGAPEVTALLKRTKHESTLRLACEYLSRHGDEAARGELMEIALQRRRLLGLGGGFSAPVRAAAAWAAGKLHASKEADWLDRLDRDPSREVRSVAKLLRRPQ